MAFVLPPTQVALSAPLNNAPPSDILENSTNLPSEYLFHNLPRTVAGLRNAISLHQHQPQILQNQMNVRNQNIVKTPTLPKRGVNSWMAFRSFYSRIFASFQQKSTSIYIKQMWDSDPFKAKWTIIAKSYTSIRDYVGKSNASLDTFLNMVCPKLGVIDINDYFVMMNWVVESSDDGSIRLYQSSEPDMSTFPKDLLSSNMTERDIIHYCASQQYITSAAAIAIAGPNPVGGVSNNGQPQQGLLASALNMSFIQQAAINPVAAATNVLGIRVGDILNGDTTGLYGWTSNMADLYHAEEASYDIDSILGQQSGDTWGTFDVRDPGVLNDVLEDGGVRNGYIAPDVSDADNPAY